MNATDPNAPTVGWILYDASCGICCRSASLLENALVKRGFVVVALQEEWVMETLDLPPESLLEDMRILLADGTQLAGAEAYRYAMRRIGWALPLYFFSMLPIGRQIFDFAYRVFAQNRQKISAACAVRSDRNDHHQSFR